MEIKQIEIRNCRGIKELIISDSIIANKPNILVALEKLLWHMHFLV